MCPGAGLRPRPRPGRHLALRATAPGGHPDDEDREIFTGTSHRPLVRLTPTARRPGDHQGVDRSAPAGPGRRPAGFTSRRRPARRRRASRAEGREADDRVGDRVQVGRGGAADAVEQGPDGQPVEHGQGLAAVDRGEGEAAVAEDLDQHPAGGHHHQGPELRVGDHPEGQLHPGPGHGRDQHPRPQPGGQVGVGGGQPVRPVQPQPHPAHIRLVHDPGRGRLQRHRPPDPPGRRQRLLQAGRHLGRHHRHPPVAQQGQPLRLVQRPPSVAQPRPPPSPGRLRPAGSNPPPAAPRRLGRHPDPPLPAPPVGERSRPGGGVSTAPVHSPRPHSPRRARKSR